MLDSCCAQSTNSQLRDVVEKEDEGEEEEVEEEEDEGEEE